MMKLSRYRKVLMHGVGLSHATKGGGPTFRDAPWWRDINGVWWTTRNYVYYLTFRRAYRHWYSW